MQNSGPGTRSFAGSLGGWRTEHRRLAEGLATAIREAVLDGRIPVGSKLPSGRALADGLQVSRGTVVAALAALREQGWISTRQGSSSMVRLPPQLTERTMPWSVDSGAPGARLDLTMALTTAPYQAYLAALQRATTQCAPLLIDTGKNAAGLPRLREILAERYTHQGLPTRPEQILVTSGAMAAFALIADQFHDPRRPVLVDNPTLPRALALLRQRKARLISTPVTAAGWDQDHLTRTIQSTRPALAYLIPDFHNPTGSTMPDHTRSQLATLAAQHDLTIIADETMRDLDLRTPPQPTRHLTGTQVITISGTSKTIWSGLRIGWIRATTAHIRQLLLNPLQAHLSPPPLEQLIACDLLTDLDTLLHQRRTPLLTQRDHLAALLTNTDQWSFSTPDGGLVLWLRLHHVTATELANRAAATGLALTPGPHFSPHRTHTKYLRLPFTATPHVLDQVATTLHTALPTQTNPPANDT